MPTLAQKRPATEFPEKERKHLARCLTDLPFYSKHHLKIRTKKADLIPFNFNDAQRIVHSKLSRQLKETGRIRAVVLKARQTGISTLVAARFFRSAHLFPLRRCVVIADERDRSSAIFEFYERYYSNLIEQMQPGIISTQRGNVLHMRNDSQIVVETAMDAEAGRGTTVQALHCSEVAFWPNAEDVFVSLAQAVPDEGSEVILESTANGVGNFFHQFWDQAEEGSNGYLAIFLPWWIHDEYELPLTDEEREAILKSRDPYEREALDRGFFWEGEFHKLSPEKLAWRKRVGIPEKCAGNLRKFRAEYPTTAREAFVATGETFFDKDSLEAYEKKARPPLRRGTLKDNGKGRLIVYPDPLGHLRIWELPQKDSVYVISADTASGKSVSSGDPDNERGGRDFSCADVYCPKTRKQVAQLHGRMHPETFAQHLVWLGYLYNTALIGPERNFSSGETVVQKVYDEHEYPNRYFARQVNTKKDGRLTSRWGWWTTKVTRPIMLDELAEAVRNIDIDISCKETIRELFTFILNDRGIPTAQDGTHDDRVISLAIALQLAQAEHEPPKGKLPETEVYSGSGAFDYGW